MAAVLVQLLPLVLGAALAPLWVIIVLLLLASPGGLLKASAFVLGMTLARLLQFVVFSFVFGASPDAQAENGGSSPVVSTLLLVVGILLLIAAFQKWRKVADPDDPPPQWMQTIDQTSPLKALGLGAALIGVGLKMWVFTLSAIATISAANLGQIESLLVFLGYLVLAQSVLIVAILIYALAPQASVVLRRAIDWLTRYNRPISITVALIFGAYFTWDGIRGLLA